MLIPSAGLCHPGCAFHARAEKFALVDAVTKAVKADPDHGMTDINAIDGIRVTTDHGWWLIRHLIQVLNWWHALG